MADVHNPAQRRRNMRAIGSQNTAIEQRLAHDLRELGIAFRIQDRALPGTPDFVIDAARCVIFTHGCFWHRHDCALFKIPATRTEFWLSKIAANVARDQRAQAALRADGWRVLVVWECALRGRGRLEDSALCERLEEWVCAGSGDAHIDSAGIHAD